MTPFDQIIKIMDVRDEITAERIRQVDLEGWTPEHDDQHTDGSLARAAACYAHPEPLYVHNPVRGDSENFDTAWPVSWSTQWFKPTYRRRDLVKAGALIMAEIERLDRAVSKQ